MIKLFSLIALQVLPQISYLNRLALSSTRRKSSTLTAKTLYDERPHHLVNHLVKERLALHHRPAEKRKFNGIRHPLSTPELASPTPPTRIQFPRRPEQPPIIRNHQPHCQHSLTSPPTPHPNRTNPTPRHTRDPPPESLAPQQLQRRHGTRSMARRAPHRGCEPPKRLR